MMKVLLFSILALAAPEQKSHVHGTGHVSLAFDGSKGKINLETPAEALFGFEHEPKTQKDKRKKDEALKKLEEKISEMIAFEAAIKCEIKKEMFEINKTNGHSDVSAEFSVQCERPVSEGSVSFNFQKVFPGLKNVQVDVLTENVQKSLKVKKNGETLGFK